MTDLMILLAVVLILAAYFVGRLHGVISGGDREHYAHREGTCPTPREVPVRGPMIRAPLDVDDLIEDARLHVAAASAGGEWKRGAEAAIAWFDGELRARLLAILEGARATDDEGQR